MSKFNLYNAVTELVLNIFFPKREGVLDTGIWLRFSITM